MFRTVFPSIIRNSRLYIQQQAYVKQMHVAVCTVLNSWWWTERSSETCRVYESQTLWMFRTTLFLTIYYYCALCQTLLIWWCALCIQPPRQSRSCNRLVLDEVKGYTESIGTQLQSSCNFIVKFRCHLSWNFIRHFRRQNASRRRTGLPLYVYCTHFWI